MKQPPKADVASGAPGICKALLVLLMYEAGITVSEVRRAIRVFVNDPLTSRSTDAGERSQHTSALDRDLKSPSLTIKKLAELLGVLGFDEFVINIQARRGGKVYEATASHKPRTPELTEDYWSQVRGPSFIRRDASNDSGDFHGSSSMGESSHQGSDGSPD